MSPVFKKNGSITNYASFIIIGFGAGLEHKTNN